MKKTSSDKVEVEKKLLPRLRFTALILIAFSLFTFTYALVADPYLEAPAEEKTPIKEESLVGLETEPDFMITKGQRLNLFLVAGVFGTIGLCCMIFFWKKKSSCP